MTRWLVIATVMLGACSSDNPDSSSSPEVSPTPSPSPTATLEDFNGQWCDAVIPLARVTDDLPTYERDARAIGVLDDSVAKFDALASDLSQAGFDEAAADARKMADALDDLADTLDALGDASFNEIATTLTRAQGRAVSRMPINELAASLGTCS